MTKDEVKIGIKRAVENTVYSERKISRFYENPNDNLATRLEKADIQNLNFRIGGLLQEFGKAFVYSDLFEEVEERPDLITLEYLENKLLEAVNNYSCPDCGRKEWGYTGENIPDHSTFKAIINGAVNCLTGVNDLLQVDTTKHVVYVACKNCKRRIIGS